jgi:uncharacterized surface protein with fasciclin (FAS1) repeats
MKSQFTGFRKSVMILLGGTAIATLAACTSPSETSETQTAPDSTVAESPAMSESPMTTAESPAGTTGADGTTGTTGTVGATGTVVEVASSDSEFSTLASALQAAGLTETLEQAGPYTVFAPTNEAFQALPPETLDALLRPENKAELERVLSYHVVPKAISSTQITAGEVPTVEGESITAKVDSATNSVEVNDATVTGTDISASNGVIHKIDKVLLPPDFDPATLK